MLDLAENRLGANGAKRTTAALVRLLTPPEHCSLATLDLSNNRLSSTPVVALARPLALNATLTALDLSFNRVGSLGASALAGALLCNSTTLVRPPK